MGHSSPVNSILLNSDEAELYSGLKGGMIVLWDIYNQKVKINLQGHSTSITSMSIYRNNNTPCVLASASGDGKIKLWDLKSKSAATNFKGHFSQVDSLCFSPDFNYLASGAQDGSVKLWDIRLSNKSLKEICDKDQKGINCIDFNNYELAFAYGGKDKMIRYYSLEKFNKIGQTSTDRLPIQKIAFDNEGKNIFSATDESLKYWEINERGLSLVDMFETGWNKLQSFKYLEGKAICALATYSNKISYYLLKYKELFKSPNMRLREDPNMANIFEVQETEDSTFDNNNSNNIKNKKKDVNNGSGKKRYEKKEEKNIKIEVNTSKNINNNKTIKSINNENYNDLNSLGISKFINNNDLTNMSISLNDISYSKIENESSIVKNAMDIIGQNNNNYNSKINTNKPINPDDIVLPKNKNIQNKSKHKIAENKDSIDEQIDKIMIGDISNMSDISDTKGDLTLGMIFGNHNKPEENNNNIKNKEDKNDKDINGSNQKIKEEYEFKEFGENDVEQFLGNNSLNKNLDISEMPSMIGENTELNIFNDLSILSSIKNPNPSLSKLDSTKQKLTLDDLSSMKGKHQRNNNNINDNKSFVSLKSNETLGIDLNQLIEENGMINDTTKNIIPQSQDLPILQEINSQHDNMRKEITKRFNGLKIVTEWWKKSDIPSTLNALRILKDYSIVKDFFYYAIISRQDITKIPLTLECAIVMLPYVHILMKSRIDVYWKTACRAGMTFLKIFMEKIEILMKNRKGVIGTGDKILEKKIKKCEETVKIFRQIYESSFLRRHIKEDGNNNP